MSTPVQQENITPTPDLDQLCINTIRTLSLDAVEKADPLAVWRDLREFGLMVFRSDRDRCSIAVEPQRKDAVGIE